MFTSFLQSSVFKRQAGAGLGHLKSSPTKHIEADFFGLHACFVLGDAGVIAFIQFLHVLYGQFGAVLVQDVLLSRLKRDVVAAAEEEDVMSDNQPDGVPSSPEPCSSAPRSSEAEASPSLPALTPIPQPQPGAAFKNTRAVDNSGAAERRRGKSICIKRN